MPQFKERTQTEVKANANVDPYNLSPQNFESRGKKFESQRTFELSMEEKLSRKYGKRVIKVGPNKFKVLNEPYRP